MLDLTSADPVLTQTSEYEAVEHAGRRRDFKYHELILRPQKEGKRLPKYRTYWHF